MVKSAKARAEAALKYALRSERRALLAIALVVLALYGSLSPLVEDFVKHDPIVYGLYARSIIEGHPFEGNYVPRVYLTQESIPRVKVWSREPLYILALAFFFWLLSPSYLAMKVANTFFAALAVVPLYNIFRRFLSYERSLLATLLTLSFPFLAFQAIFTGNEMLALLLSSTALCIALNGSSRRRMLALGGVLGLLFLTRYDNGFFLMLSVLAYYSLKRGPVQTLLKNAAPVYASFAAVSLPWMVRNQLVFGSALPYPLPVVILFCKVYVDVLSFYAVIFSVVAIAVFLVALFKGLVLFVEEKLEAFLVACSAVLLLLGYFTRDYSLLVFIALVYTFYLMSPALFSFVAIGLLLYARRLGILHPFLTYPLLLFAGYSLTWVYSYRYVLLTLPFVMVLAFLALDDLSLLLKRLFKLKRKELAYAFLLLLLIASYAPHYAIFARSNELRQGAFKAYRWYDVGDWINTYTSKSSVVLAKYAIVAFYTGRPTIWYPSYLNTTNLVDLIKKTDASYIVIDRKTYLESLKLAPHSLLRYLYEYSVNTSYVWNVYTTRDPTIKVYFVKRLKYFSYENLVFWKLSPRYANFNLDEGLAINATESNVTVYYENPTNETKILELKVDPLNLKDAPPLCFILKYSLNSTDPMSFMVLRIEDPATGTFLSITLYPGGSAPSYCVMPVPATKAMEFSMEFYATPMSNATLTIGFLGLCTVPAVDLLELSEVS